MFAVLFDSSGRSIDATRIAQEPSVEGHEIHIPPEADHIAIISRATESASDGDVCLRLPATGRIGVVGRIRLDRRADLIARLGAAHDICTADLVGLAFERWGDDFVENIAGDFCFVALDTARHRIMATRDQLGVRALFYTRVGNIWLISDSLDWLARHTPHGQELDDYWIADFLTAGFSREFERTVYRDIKRLPPAHVLQLNREATSIRRYWKLDIAEPVHLESNRDYGDRFRALVRDAIADRMPNSRVGIAMSGGLDSTTLAALTVEQTQDTSRVVAECMHYERVMDIGEGHYAELAARHIGIDLRVRAVDDLVYDPSWRDRGIRPAEPTTSMLDAHHLRAIGQDRSKRAHVWFEGEGPDNALELERGPYLRWLLRQRALGRFGKACFQYASAKGLAGWRQTLGRYLRRPLPSPQPSVIPLWLDRQFVEDLKLGQRIEDLGAGGDSSHPWHPVAVASFTSPVWQGYFATCDFEDSLAPVVHRHPYLDLRVVNFMLSVPPIPWGWKKYLIREAMRTRLPQEILDREKTPLSLHPDVIAARRERLPLLSSETCLRRFVDVPSLPTVDEAPVKVLGLFAVHALDGWLSGQAAALRPRGNSAILEA